MCVRARTSVYMCLCVDPCVCVFMHIYVCVCFYAIVTIITQEFGYFFVKVSSQIISNNIIIIVVGIAELGFVVIVIINIAEQ